MAATWTWAVGDPAPATVWRYPLGLARSRRIVWQLDGGSYATFTEDGRSPEAAVIAQLGSDLGCWRDGVLLFRGRIGSENDEISENTHSSTFYAMDYRGMLEFRVVDEWGVSYWPADQANIAWGLVSSSQAKTNGNWGITQGTGATNNASGISRYMQYQPGKSIKEAITELGQLDDGFEWEVSPSLALTLWHGAGRGANNGVILQLGGSVLRAHRSINPADFANAVVVEGSHTGAYRLQSATLATDTRGLWEDSESNTSIKDGPALGDRAVWLLNDKLKLKSALRLMLMPGFWQGKSHLWIGDYVTVRIQSGRLNITGTYRVTEIAVDPGGSAGDEQVDVVVVPS